MPTGTNYGRLNQPSGFRHIDRFGPSESALAQFLYPFAWRDVHFQFDDFHQVATLTDWWTLGTDASATAFVTNAGSGGRIQGSSGAVDNNVVAILSSADWLGDQNCGCEARWQVDDLTDYSFEAGFNDPLTDDTLPAVTNVDTPATGNGATDVAVIHLDTDRTLKTEAFVTDGGTSNMNATATSLGTREPTAATYLSTRIQLSGDASAGFHVDANGAVQESARHGEVIGSSIEGGTALTCRFMGRTRSGTATVYLLDYIAIWQDR